MHQDSPTLKARDEIIAAWLREVVATAPVNQSSIANLIGVTPPGMTARLKPQTERAAIAMSPQNLADLIVGLPVIQEQQDDLRGRLMDFFREQAGKAMQQTTVGNFIRCRSEALGLGPSELSRKCKNTDTSGITKLINNKRLLSVDVMRQVADALQLSPVERVQLELLSNRQYYRDSFGLKGSTAYPNHERSAERIAQLQDQMITVAQDVCPVFEHERLIEEMQRPAQSGARDWQSRISDGPSGLQIRR